jgi:NitT/TauT family transport system permease protein
MSRNRWSALASQAITPLIYAVMLAVWEFCSRRFKIPSWILPAPSEIVSSATAWGPELLYSSWVTFNETVIGFLLGLILAMPFAVIIAFTTTARRVLYPILLALQSIPKIALAPLVILWLGIGQWPKIVIVILVCFFPILVNVIAGFEAVPRNMLDLMHSLRASEITTFRRLRVPIATPYLFTGCKIAITLAVIGAVIGEFVAAQEGLGYMILISTSQAQTPLAFASIVALTIISVVLFYAIELLEKQIVTWSP